MTERPGKCYHGLAKAETGNLIDGKEITNLTLKR